MAVLETIRTKFGLMASLIIAFGLLLFIVDPSSVMSAIQNMSSKNDVGVIDGQAITYMDFQQDIQTYTTINEIMTGTSSQSAQQQAQVRNMAWQELIYKFLFIPKANDAGIRVGDKEIVDMTTGQHISPLLTNNPVFMGQDGKFSKQRLLSFLQSLPSDPSGRAKLYWDYLQNNIVNQDYYNKYTSLFVGSMFNSPFMQEQSIINHNTQSTVKFVLLPYSPEKDSTIKVSQAEIRDYYNNHKKFFKQPASRDIEYVAFEVKPSEEDIAANAKAVANLIPEFAKSTNVKNFLLRNSDKPYTSFWFSKDQLKSLSPGVEEFVWNNKGKSEVSDLIREGNTFYLARVMATKSLPDSIYVKHILLGGPKAAAEADSLVKLLNKGAKFADLALKNSLDKQSAADGVQGNIGWLSQMYMIPGFESLFSTALNKPVVLKTQYGTHIVEVTKTTKPHLKKQVAILVKETIPSKNTFNDVYAKANKFSSLAGSNLASYQKAVDSMHVYSHSLNRMQQGTDRIGVMNNAKELCRWAFDNKPGKVSDIKTIDNNFFVVAVVKAVHKYGYSALDEVENTIKDFLYSKKLAEKRTEDLAQKTAGFTSLDQVAKRFNLSISTQENISFDSSTNQSLDPAFIGAVSVAPLNKLCGPIQGNIGTFYFTVEKRDKASFFTAADAQKEDERIANALSTQVIPVMMNDAGVIDNRAKFF